MGPKGGVRATLSASPLHPRSPEISMIKLLIPLLAVAAFGPLLQEEKRPEPMQAKVGAEAPHFRLNDQAGKLTAVGGKSERWTVLAFFPKAFTGG